MVSFNKILVLVGVVSTLLCSCKKYSYFPDEMEHITVSIVRFDSLLMTITPTNADSSVRALYAEPFTTFYMQDILGVNPHDTAYFVEALPAFLQDTVYHFQQTNALAQEQYRNIDTLQSEFNEAFTRIHYLWPERPIPMVYFFLSGFNASVCFFGEDLAVGVDMYLGSDYPLYNHVVYEYQKVTMCKSALTIDAVSAYLFKNIPYMFTSDRLIEQMLYRGKVMYLLAQLFPERTEADIMGYTSSQEKWCKEYERAIWNRIMDKGDLFKNDRQLIASYLNEGPFCGEISQDAPGRLGTWLGMQLVKSYMENNRSVTIPMLLSLTDAKQLIKDSRYDP